MKTVFKFSTGWESFIIPSSEINWAKDVIRLAVQNMNKLSTIDGVLALGFDKILLLYTWKFKRKNGTVVFGTCNGISGLRSTAYEYILGLENEF